MTGWQAEHAHFFRLLSDTMHSTSSNLQLVHGICSTTLQRTLRVRQHWQALDARLLTLLFFLGPLEGRPASVDLRFNCRPASIGSSMEEVSDIALVLRLVVV